MYSNRISVLVLLIILIHFTYEQDSNAFEVRDFSLNRPYASGRLKLFVLYSI